MKLCLVHCPDSALHVLHPHEALVEGQIVSHSVLQDKHYFFYNLFKGIKSLFVFILITFYLQPNVVCTM